MKDVEIFEKIIIGKEHAVDLANRLGERDMDTKIEPIDGMPDTYKVKGWPGKAKRLQREQRRIHMSGAMNQLRSGCDNILNNFMRYSYQGQKKEKNKEEEKT